MEEPEFTPLKEDTQRGRTAKGREGDRAGANSITYEVRKANDKLTIIEATDRDHKIGENLLMEGFLQKGGKLLIHVYMTWGTKLVLPHHTWRHLDGEGTLRINEAATRGGATPKASTDLPQGPPSKNQALALGDVSSSMEECTRASFPTTIATQ